MTGEPKGSLLQLACKCARPCRSLRASIGLPEPVPSARAGPATHDSPLLPGRRPRCLQVPSRAASSSATATATGSVPPAPAALRAAAFLERAPERALARAPWNQFRGRLWTRPQRLSHPPSLARARQDP